MTYIIEAITEAMGRETALFSGTRATRLTAAVAQGATTLPVESTLDWPAAGRLAVDGILYDYSGLTSTTLTGITHVNSGATITGTAQQHRTHSAVQDVSGQFSQVELMRRRFFVEYADGDDLTTLGNSLGVPRAPALSDAQYRGIIKAVAYSPRGTLHGLRQALNAILGDDAYYITEDLIRSPGKVQVHIIQSALVEASAIGKLYMEGRKSFLASGTGITLDATPLAVGDVRIKPEDVTVDCARQKPSVPTLVEYTGQTPAAAWTCVGTEANVTVTAAVGACRFTGTAALYYKRDARITPTAYVAFEATCAIGSDLASSTDARGAGLVIDDQARLIGAGAVLTTAGFYAWRFFNPITGALLGAQTSTWATGTVGHSVRVVKRGQGAVSLYVDGTWLETLNITAFPASNTNQNTARFGILSSQASAPNLYVANVFLHVTCPDDLWSLQGTVLSSPSARRLTLTPAPGAGDIGHVFEVYDGTTVNAQGGRNNGTYLLESIPSPGEVQIIGTQLSGGGNVDSGNPTRLTYGTRLDGPFVYPNDLGKTLVVTGSTLGNNGSYTIVGLRDPSTFADLHVGLSHVGPVHTNVCEVSGATFVAETGLSIRIDPVFAFESGLRWKVSNGGSFTGTAVTLRAATPLPLGATILDVLYTRLLSAEVQRDTTQANSLQDAGPPASFNKYPFYVFDPAVFVYAYINDLMAAGIVVELSLV